MSCSSWPMRPGTVKHLVLLALRAGPCGRENLLDRFGTTASHALNDLVQEGHVAVSGSHKETEYRITEKGKAACPPRRSIPITPRHA